MPMCKALTYKGMDCGNPGTYKGYCWRHRRRKEGDVVEAIRKIYG